MKILNLKEAAEQLEEIIARFADGDRTPVFVGRWGRKPEAVILPHDWDTNSKEKEK